MTCTLVDHVGLGEPGDLADRGLGPAGVDRDRQAELLERPRIRRARRSRGTALAGRLPPWPRQATPSAIRPSLEYCAQSFFSFSRSGRSIGDVHVVALLWPVGEARAEPGLLQRAQIGPRVVGAPDIVAPVVHEGDAGIDRLGGGEPRALVDVVRRAQFAEQQRGAEIAVVGLLARHAAEQRVPHVPVRLDQARQHDHAAAVDGPRARRVEVLSDRDDDAVAHVNVAILDVAVLLHRHHIGFADDDVAACREFRRSGRERAPRKSGGAGRGQRGSAAQQAAAREIKMRHGNPLRWSRYGAISTGVFVRGPSPVIRTITSSSLAPS